MKKRILTRSRSLVYPTPQIGVVCAAIFTIMAVAQLFDFEDMSTLIASSAPFGMDVSSVIAAVLVAAEVLAIPFLLGMRLSPLMRGVSLVSGVLALLYWLAIGVYNVWNFSTASGNVGLFGSHIIAPSGWWLVFFMVGLAALFSWYTCKYFTSRH